jgi:hexokinase
MNSLENEVIEYLQNQKMHVSSIDNKKVIENMISEMDHGLSGNQSSYDMIPTYVKKNDNIKYDEEIIVLDAGGTNFRVCTVTISEDRSAKIENLNIYPMPGMKTEVSKDEFFETIYNYIKPVIEKSNKIGFCFSYPGEIDENLDCTLLFFAKEIKAPEVIGTKIGENVNRVIEKNGHSPKEITILNDTIATLLAGMLNPEKHQYENYIGFILGTGINTGYMEENRNIKKIKQLNVEESQAINMESGRYGKYPHSEIDKAFFNTTINPNEFNFEKIMSGAYLGGLCTTLFKKAAEDKLFSEADAAILTNLNTFHTPDISYLIENTKLPDNMSHYKISEEGLKIMKYLSENIVDRVAMNAALLLTATAIKEGGGKEKDKPLCLSINGSTLQKMYGLRERFDYWLDEIMVKENKIYYEILMIDNAPIIGSAIAALTR